MVVDHAAAQGYSLRIIRMSSEMWLGSFGTVVFPAFAALAASGQREDFSRNFSLAMQAVILSAGQGRRLLPLTADRPKCLVDLHGKTLLQWQLDALLAAGVGPVTVVTGYASDAVEAVIARHYAGQPIGVQYNPFFQVADNLGSCWIARAALATT